MNALVPFDVRGCTEAQLAHVDTWQLKKSVKSILALLLFGSRARGDHNKDSDTDLLLVTNEPRPRQGAVGHVSLSFYPFDHLCERSRAGDLFICHLVKEAKVISDENGMFEKLRTNFCVRANYRDDIESASELGWFLTQFGPQLCAPDFVNRRIAWCVRTILIAHSVQNGSPYFSADGLEAFSGSAAVGHLIRAKSAVEVSSERLLELAEFLRVWGAPNTVGLNALPIDYVRRFRARGNNVALQAVRNCWSSENSLYI